MTCREFVGFLDDYLSREMPETVRIDFEAHLAECTNCRAYLQTYKTTLRFVEQACVEPEEPIPADVPRELIEAILKAYERSRW